MPSFCFHFPRFHSRARPSFSAHRLPFPYGGAGAPTVSHLQTRAPKILRGGVPHCHRLTGLNTFSRFPFPFLPLLSVGTGAAVSLLLEGSMKEDNACHHSHSVTAPPATVPPHHPTTQPHHPINRCWKISEAKPTPTHRFCSHLYEKWVMCLPTCLPAYLPTCYLAKLPPCHPVTLSPCHPVTLSPCHPVTLPLGHPSTLPPNQGVAQTCVHSKY